MEKKCKNCRAFDQYYIKGYCEFFEVHVGHCMQKREVMPKDGLCENWQYKYVKRKIDKPRVIKALEKSLTDIAAMAQIFTEEQDKGELS